MAGYCTSQDLQDRFGSDELLQLADRDDDGVIDQTVVDQAISDAADEIDAYVGVRYTLPLASTPPVLTRIACDIARYRLYDDKATDEVAARYRDAVAFLKSLASGKVKLGASAGNAAPTTDNTATVTSDPLTFPRKDHSFL